MTLITQSEFAQRKNVTRAAVTQWKNDGRIIMEGNLVDLEATEAKMIPGSRHRSKRRIPARGDAINLTPETVKLPNQLNNAAPKATPRAGGVPDLVLNVSTQIDGGAVDMAWLLAGHLPMAAVRSLVETWAKKQRTDWVGGPGLPACIADEDQWPKPPAGCSYWSEHALFTAPAVTEAEWGDIEAEPKVAA